MVEMWPTRGWPAIGRYSSGNASRRTISIHDAHKKVTALALHTSDKCTMKQLPQLYMRLTIAFHVNNNSSITKQIIKHDKNILQCRQLTFIPLNSTRYFSNKIIRVIIRSSP